MKINGILTPLERGRKVEMLEKLFVKAFLFFYVILGYCSILILRAIVFITTMVQRYLNKKMSHLVFLCFLSLGCAGLFPFTTVPGPRPGMVIISNENTAIWAEVWVFRGNCSLEELVAIDQTGQPTLVRTPILFWVNKEGHLVTEELVTEGQRARDRWLCKFRIVAAQSPIVQGAKCTPVGQVIFFSPRPAEYTLLVRWNNFYGRLVPVYGRAEEIIHFRTRGYPFEYDYRYKNLDGTPIGADRIIRLSSYY